MPRISTTALLFGMVCASVASAVRAEPAFTEYHYTFPGSPPPINQELRFHQVDINGDGVNDVSFRHQPLYLTGQNLGLSENRVNGLNGTSFAADGQYNPSNYKGRSFSPGESINENLDWRGSVSIHNAEEGHVDPQFLESDTSIGVRLFVDGQPHYAWVGVQYVPGRPGVHSQLVIDDFAWETTPNTPIGANVPEPAAPLLIALGVALRLARRPRRPRI